MTPRMLDGAARIAFIAAAIVGFIWLIGLTGAIAVGWDALVLALILAAVGLLAQRRARRGRASDRDFTA